MKAYGKKVWLIPDTYLNLVSKNENLSHEAICVINTSDVDAEIKLTLFFEDEKADEAQGPLRLTEDERRLVLLYRSLERPGGAVGPRFPQTKKSPGCGKKRTLTRMDNEEELR